MTLTELKYLIKLSQLNHFGKAAQACHVTQPSLSVAIHKLESELGVAIFERDRQQVRVTEIGQQIIAQAQRVLDEVSTLRDMAAGGKSQLTEPFKIGAIYTIAPYLFPNLIPKLQKFAPKMQLIIEEDFTANLRRKLIQGKLDAVIISLPFTEPNVVTQALYDEPLVVLMRKDHVLNKKSHLTANDIAAEDILLLGQGHCFRDQVIEACPHCLKKENGLQKTIEGTSLDTLRHMVASGLGITILPSTATQIKYYQSILCTKPFADPIPQRRVALAWRLSYTRPKAISALIRSLQASTLHGVSSPLPLVGEG